MRENLRRFIESGRVQNGIVALIVLNSVTIGLETSAPVMESWGGLLLTIDAVILAVFVAEMTLKLFTYGLSYFRSGWNVFDFLVICVALLPTSNGLSVMRALRIFRSLRLIKNIPKLRFIVEALLHSIPSLGWIFLLLILVFYVFAVVGTKAFGADFPQWFGTLGASMYTLFQIMTLEGWAEIARAVQVLYPAAYIFFTSFILISSYTTLNIFIAIIVNTMSEIQAEAGSKNVRSIGSMIEGEKAELKEDLLALKDAISRIEQKIVGR